ncbi:MAG: CrcB family protein, partial [Candidatus Binatia bacterium]
MKALLLVGTGGFIGSVLRYLISGLVFRLLDKPWFPVGTLAVNLLGCLAIGLLGGFSLQSSDSSCSSAFSAVLPLSP